LKKFRKNAEEHVLCVEDEPEIADLIGEVLRARGYHVDIAATGKDAISAFSKGDYALATIDYRLSDISGLEVAQEFMALKPDVPLVMVTGRGSESIAAKALRMGVADYIIKESPNTFIELLPAIVEQVLERQELINKNRIYDERLGEQKVQLQSILDTVVDGIITISETGKIQSFNLAAETIFGYKEAEVLGKNVNVLMPNPYKRKHNSYLKNFLTSGEAKIIGASREVMGLRKDGSTFPMSIAVSDLMQDKSFVFTGIVRDITEQKKAEQALIAGESLFRNFVSCIADRFWETDDKFRYTYVSELGDGAVRRPSEPMIGKTRWEIPGIDPNDELWKAHRAKLSARQPIINFIYPRTLDDGRTIWIEANAQPFFDEEGAFRGYRGTNVDITERQKAEESLRLIEIATAEERKTLQDAVESFADGFILFDAEERYVLCNDNFQNSISDFENIFIVGHTFEKIMRTRIKARNFRADIVRDENWVQQRLDDYRACRTIERESVDGRHIELRHLKTPTGGTAMIRTDISELKQTELTLRKNTDTINLMQKTAVAANEASTVEDAIQTCLNLVCAYAKWPVGHAYLVAEDGSNKITSTRIWQIDDPEKFKNFRQITEKTEFVSGVGLPGQVLSSGQPAWIVDVTKDSNFSRTKVAEDIGVKGAFAFPVFIGQDVVAVFEFFATEKVLPRDEILEIMRHVGAQVGRIIERKRAEVNLIEAREQADQANRTKSDFLSSMSHELRTPLNAILGFSQLLGSDPKEPLTKIQKKSVHHIVRGGSHLLKLIDEVLDLAKIEAGKLKLAMENVVAAPLIEECLTTIEAKAKERDIRTPDRSMYIADSVIRTDVTRFKQILLNLLSNAVKYNRKGGALVVATYETPKGMLRISITDTGEGIPEDKQSELFQPFSRLGQETTSMEGTGIGLVVTKRLVEEMGGRIGFESEIGKGSTFWIELPLSQNAKTTDKNLTSRPNKSIIKKLSGKVLYVEDNLPNLDLMKMIISRVDGLNMISANTAELGLDLARDENPDIIIMDINLPGMNGFEALKELRKMTNTNSIPIIALSANATEQDIEAGREAGFYDYQTKPIDIGSFLRTVETALQLDT
jgi:PAS domain S-box-containing protein